MTALTSWIVAFSSAVAATAAVALAREVRRDLREFVQTIEANEWRSQVTWRSQQRRGVVEDADRVDVSDPPEQVEVIDR